MNKTKMILAGASGAIGLVVLVLAFLVWQAFSAKTAAIEGDYEEGTDGLETVESRAQSMSRKTIYPCAASVSAIERDRKAVDDWCKEGLSLAARGDKTFPKTTPAQFKADLVADAKRLMTLSGGVAGKIVKPDFAFGPFRDYIAEGKMPSEAELAELQRKWDDVAMITEMLATNGVVELVDVGFAVAKKDEADEARDRKDARGKRNQRKGSAQSSNRSIDQSVISHSYVFTFTAHPAAFVMVLNVLEQCERFIVVDDFSFVRPKDVIAEAFGGGEETPASTGGRRGRRVRKSAEAETPASQTGDGDAGKNGIVTDPVLDAPMTVTMTVSVHDFRSLEKDGEGESK